MSIRVLRRKRRQPELTTRTAVQGLRFFIDDITIDPGVSTEINVIFRTSNPVISQAALEQVTMSYLDLSGPAWGTTAPTEVDYTIGTDGVNVRFLYGVEADINSPIILNIPKGWAGVKSPAGDSPTIAEPTGLGGDGWVQIARLP